MWRLKFGIRLIGRIRPIGPIAGIQPLCPSLDLRALRGEEYPAQAFVVKAAAPVLKAPLLATTIPGSHDA